MILGTVVLFLVWVAMTRSLAIPFLIAGAISTGLVVAFWYRIMPKTPSSAAKLIRHPFRSLRFVWVLMRRFAISTLSTSWLILKGGEAGRIMALPIHVEDPLARFILLNSITLTPSTISLLIEDDLLYIHWLQTAGGQSDWRGIKESFELRLRSLFEGEGNDDH